MAVTFNSDFDTGDLSQWDPSGIQVAVGAEAYAQRLTQRLRRKRAGYALRTEVRAGDVFANHERAELATPTYTEGAAHFVGFSVYMPAALLNPSPTGPNIFAQIHQIGSVEPNVPFKIYVSDDAGLPWRIVVHTIGGAWAAPYNINVATVDTKFDVGLAVFDRWDDYVVQMAHSTGAAAGRVAVWRNGELVVAPRAQPTMINGQDNYWKWGWYSDDRETFGPSVIYHDEIKIGDTFADVDLGPKPFGAQGQVVRVKAGAGHNAVFRKVAA